MGISSSRFPFFFCARECFFDCFTRPLYHRRMLIKVRVKAGERRESVRKVGDRYEVAVREKPEANMANKRVLALLAAELGVPQKKLRIIKGHHSPSKLISLVTD